MARALNNDVRRHVKERSPEIPKCSPIGMISEIGTLLNLSEQRRPPHIPLEDGIQTIVEKSIARWQKSLSIFTITEIRSISDYQRPELIGRRSRTALLLSDESEANSDAENVIDKYMQEKLSTLEKQQERRLWDSGFKNRRGSPTTRRLSFCSFRSGFLGNPAGQETCGEGAVALHGKSQGNATRY